MKSEWNASNGFLAGLRVDLGSFMRSDQGLWRLGTSLLKVPKNKNGEDENRNLPSSSNFGKFMKVFSDFNSETSPGLSPLLTTNMGSILVRDFLVAPQKMATCASLKNRFFDRFGFPAPVRGHGPSFGWSINQVLLLCPRNTHLWPY